MGNTFPQRETQNCEFKETVSDTFLKTVSAFANHEGGRIFFGVADSGKVVGINHPKNAMLKIESKINDAIKPRPNFTMHLSANNVIVVEIYEGDDKPYFYKSQAYKRADTSTRVLDTLELKRMILSSENRNFEDLPSRNQDLTFTYLEGEFNQKLGVEQIDFNILRSFELVSRGGEFTNAAALLSDNNPFPGLRIARFGDSISEIYENFSLSGRSILEQLHIAVEKYRQYYVHEKIEKATRETVEQIPEAAFREAIANALVHRAWDVSSEIRVSMFNDRIEITSPGGLPIGITPEEFLRVYLSVMRNPLVGFVFLRLKYIEQLGTGVGRIRDAYRGYLAEPEFEIYDSSVTVTLPVIQEATQLNGRFDNEVLQAPKIVVEKDLAQSHTLKDVVVRGIKDARHEKIVQVLRVVVASRREIEKLTGLSSDAVQRALKELRSQGIVQQEGKGRSTRYKLHRE